MREYDSCEPKARNLAKTALPHSPSEEVTIGSGELDSWARFRRFLLSARRQNLRNLEESYVALLAVYNTPPLAGFGGGPIAR